jgi:hypothetical protein
MDKYLERSRELSTNPYEANGDFEMNITAMDGDTAIPFSASGTVHAVGSQSGMEMQLNMNLDMDSLLEAAGDTGEIDSQTQELLSMLKDLDIDYIINYDTGMLYMRSPIFTLALGIADTNTWISVDLNSILKQSGMDLSALMSAAYGTGGFKEYIKGMLSTVPLTDKDEAALLYAQTKEFSVFFADSSFTKNGSVYTNSIKFEENGQSVAADISLTVKGDKLTKYSMSASAKMADGSMTINSAMDENDRAVVKMSMEMADIMSMDFSATFDYDKTSKTPAAAPEAGSIVISFTIPEIQ